jgi:hypothetical protein
MSDESCFETKRNLSPLSESLKKVLQLELRSSEAGKKHTLTLSSSSSFILLKSSMPFIFLMALCILMMILRFVTALPNLLFYYYLANGRTMVNVAPLPSELLLAYNFPPCASTIFLEIYRPNPVPL